MLFRTCLVPRLLGTTLGAASLLLGLVAQERIAWAQSDEQGQEDPGASAAGESGASTGFSVGGDASASNEGSSAGATASTEANSDSAKESEGTADAAKDASTEAKDKEEAPVFTASEAAKGITWDAGDWKLTFYGYAALNAMYDSTQSFGQGIHNNLIQRQGTFAGDNDQFQMSVRDSRFGFKVGAPPAGDVKASATMEMDFNGLQPVEFTEHDRQVMNPIRMRHYYMLVETPVLDVLAGQYFDVLGWGGKGFFPNTLAFLGLTGEVYHRQAQLRLSKTLNGETLGVEAAAAASRAAHKAAGIPDFQAGLRFMLNSWTGARAQGYGQPGIGPLALGVSGIVRRFEVAEFLPTPGTARSATGVGYAINAFVPVIPAKSPEKRANALSLIGEYSDGEGIGDLYTELSGGLMFPTMPNPAAQQSQPPTYPQNIDSGFVTFDGNGSLKKVKWQGFVANLQYYLPIADGKVWVAGSISQVHSSNLRALTPLPSRGGIYTRSSYADVSLFVALTKQLQVGAAFQSVTQKFADGVSAKNYRTELATHFFF
jgi:hypothetical protein